MLSRAAIQRECAFTYMNAVSRKNLTDARAVDANDVRTALNAGAGDRRCHRHRAVSPDDRDMHVGRERPPEGRARGEEGGSQMGVAHALLAALLGCDSGADSRPAAQSAAGCRREAADWQEDRASVIVQRTMRPLYSANIQGVSRGTVLPSFGSPTLFPPLESRHGQPGRAKAAV